MAKEPNLLDLVILSLAPKSHEGAPLPRRDVVVNRLKRPIRIFLFLDDF